MNTVKVKTFTANVTLGLLRQYSNQKISLSEFKTALLRAQEHTKATLNVALSAKINPCEIVFLGQEEPSIEVNFIQYPKFPQEENTLKKAIIQLTKLLMRELDQNRVVIVFSDETIMLEQSEAIDPKIKIEAREKQP